MKTINTQRFKKSAPEDISFQGSPILDNPPKPVKNLKSVRTDEHPNERTDTPIELSDEKEASLIDNIGVYSLEIPQERRKIRHSFDIFEDQKTSLEKIQLAIKEANNIKKPALGDLVQEAIDRYIKLKSKELGNIKIITKK